MLKKEMRRIGCGLALLLICHLAVAQSDKVEPLDRKPVIPVAGIVDQRDFPDSINGCGPASILNLLKFSGPEYLSAYQTILGPDEGIRMRSLVDKYFKNRPSVVYPSRNRWGVHGIHSADLVSGLNEFLDEKGIPKLEGQYLDRQKEESASNHLKRCHDLISASLDRDVSPILSLRSYVVQRRKEGEGEKVGWETGYHHYVVVRRISSPLLETGFELEVLEPYRGKKTHIYLHPESNGQPFRALKGLLQNGKWLGGEPFLLALAPDLPTLRPRDVTWEHRYIVVSNFLIGAF